MDFELVPRKEGKLGRSIASRIFEPCLSVHHASSQGSSEKKTNSAAVSRYLLSTDDCLEAICSSCSADLTQKDSVQSHGAPRHVWRFDQKVVHLRLHGSVSETSCTVTGHVTGQARTVKRESLYAY